MVQLKKVHHIDDVIEVVNEISLKYEQYCRALGDREGMSFGEWILYTRYPGVSAAQHSNLLDMVRTPRTSDARTWFIACLTNHVLPLHPINSSVSQEETTALRGMFDQNTN